MTISFESLNLTPQLLDAIEQSGYKNPTPIQQQAIPPILEGSDILALAETGSGKTSAFTLPLINQLSMTTHTARVKKSTRALILTPTRELAAQIGENIQAHSRQLPIKSVVIFGGVGINPQISKLRRGADIVVATPGRLLDLYQQHAILFDQLDYLVLDEADRMLDMGFIRDVKKILSLLPEPRQNMLFSATLPNNVQQLARELMTKPVLIEVGRRNRANDKIKQQIYLVDKSRKKELLSHMIGDQNWGQVLVFTRTKHNADNLCKRLVKDGLTAAAIHGNKSQGARTRALTQFKTGALKVLVATDIAARGIDIANLPYVVNFELPTNPEDYVHRIGRTGRAGKRGVAISLVCQDEKNSLKGIEKQIKAQIPAQVMPGYEPEFSTTTEAPPSSKQRKRRPRRGKSGAAREG